MKTTPPLSDTTLSMLHNRFAGSDFVLLDTSRISRENHHSLLFTDPVSRITIENHGQLDTFLQTAQDWLDKGYYLAGWLSYELGYLLEPTLMGLLPVTCRKPLANLGVFKAPSLHDHSTQTANEADIYGGPNDITRKHTENEDGYSISNLHLNIDKKSYLQALDTIRAYIAAGDTYQVNYTLKLLFDFAGSPMQLYQALRRNQSVSYGAYIQNGSTTILSLSPELFFRKQGSTCTVRPMKGTFKRGRTASEDKNNIHFLQTDSKNRSENVMIVDLLRNDLGRLSKHGTVRVSSLFDVETYETLHQMTSTIKGELPSTLSLFDLFKALFPCGSVTGAPKIRTMEIIRELEPEERGVYTGAIGYLSPEGDAVFNVPIRTVVLEDNRGEMGIGSGIVFDSEPEKEWQECQLKADFLTRPRPKFELIETLLWQQDQGYWLLRQHLDRLERSAHYFHFVFERSAVEMELNQAADTFNKEQKSERVRLLLAKDGSIKITSMPCDMARPVPQTVAGPLPKVAFSDQKTDSSDPFLFHKTTLRHLYNEEREKAVSNGFYEVLFCNEKEEVTEGAISTLFIKKDNVFYTPPVSCGLLAGVFRSYFLSAESGHQVYEKVLTGEDLATADAIYVANSVRGIIQVSL